MKEISKSSDGQRKEVIYKGETKHIQLNSKGNWMYCTSYTIKDGQVKSREFAQIGEEKE